MRQRWKLVAAQTDNGQNQAQSEEAQRQEKEKQEKERQERERQEKEQQEKEQQEREQKEKEQQAKERQEQEQREKERQEQERQEQERQALERQAQEQQAIAAEMTVQNSEPVVIQASGSGEVAGTSRAVPRVIVTGFATDPGTVPSGANFRLVIHIKNTSASTAVTNLLFDLRSPTVGTGENAEAPAFLPASGSSSIYLDRIGPGETKDIAMDLNSRANLQQKPYSVDMSIKYEDGSGGQYDTSSSLAIPVQQQARFEVSEIKLSPEEISVDQETNVTCKIYNTGRVKMYNVKAVFTGNAIQTKEQFVGNLESGSTGLVDAMIRGEKESKKSEKCKLTVTYEDEQGQSASFEREFGLSVTKAQETAGTLQEVNQKTSKLPVVPVCGVMAALVLAAVLGVRIRRKKKQHSQQEDMEDELERFIEDE